MQKDIFEGSGRRECNLLTIQIQSRLTIQTTIGMPCLFMSKSVSGSLNQTTHSNGTLKEKKKRKSLPIRVWYLL